MQKLSLTLLAALIPLVTASLALGSYLNYAGVRSHFLELIDDRMSTVAHRIANDAEVAMSVGVPLASQDVMNVLLQREAEADPMILSVDIVSSAGVVLFSSDAARRGLDDDPLAPEALRSASTINTAFGTNEGDAVVRASYQAVHQHLDTLGSNIMNVAVPAILASLAVVGAAVLVSVRGLWRRLTERAPTAAGAMVPAELRPSIAAVDEAHAAIADRLGVAPPATDLAHPATGAGG